MTLRRVSVSLFLMAAQHAGRDDLCLGLVVLCYTVLHQWTEVTSYVSMQSSYMLTAECGIYNSNCLPLTLCSSIHIVLMVNDMHTLNELTHLKSTPVRLIDGPTVNKTTPRFQIVACDTEGFLNRQTWMQQNNQNLSCKCKC